MYQEHPDIASKDAKTLRSQVGQLSITGTESQPAPVESFAMMNLDP